MAGDHLTAVSKYLSEGYRGAGARFFLKVCRYDKKQCTQGIIWKRLFRCWEKYFDHSGDEIQELVSKISCGCVQDSSAHTPELPNLILPALS